MTPDRKITINGKTIEEFYWNGKSVVYVNNRATDKSFDELKDELQNETTKK